MKGLIFKDICLMATEIKYIAVLLAGMIFLQNEWLYTFAIVYASVLPVSALGYDERAKWDNMAKMLPFTSGQLVGSKYILGYLATGIAALSAVFGRCLGASGVVSAEDFLTIAIAVCIAVIIEAVQLPLMFWVGVEKGRLLFIVFTVAAASAMYSVMGILEESAIERTGQNILFAAAAAAAICSLISFLISNKSYQRAR